MVPSTLSANFPQFSRKVSIIVNHGMFQNKRAKIKKQAGTRNALAYHLLAQGLYNHATVPVISGSPSTDDEDMKDDDDDDD